MNPRVYQIFFPIAGTLLLLGFVAQEGLSIGVTIGTVMVLVSVLTCQYFESQMPVGSRPGLALIFTTAVVARWVVATGVHLLIYQKRPGLFAPDELYYEWLGEYGAAYLAGHVPSFPDQIPSIGWIIAICYWLVGTAPLLPKFINGVAGGWTAVITALIALRLFSPAVARRAGYLAALMPSLVLWGSLNTKDNAALLGAELTLYSFMRMRDGFRLSLLLPFAFGALCVVTNRSYELVFVAAGLGLSLVFSDRRYIIRNLLAAGAVIALVVVLLRRQDDKVLALATDESTLEHVMDLRGGYSQDTGSTVNLDLVDTSTTTGLVVWLPFGLGYFFFAPFPFAGTSMIAISTSPEMIVWYLAMPSLFRGMRELFRRRQGRRAAPLLIYVATSSIGWAIAVTNVGTLYRYRAQILFLPLVFIAADMIRRRELRQRTVARTAPPPSRFLASVPASGLLSNNR